MSTRSLSLHLADTQTLAGGGTEIRFYVARNIGQQRSIRVANHTLRHIYVVDAWSNHAGWVTVVQYDDSEVTDPEHAARVACTILGLDA